MIVTRKALPRRTFLRGAGVTLALPFLESMVPAQTPLAKTAATGRTRFASIYVPHGATMYKWTPATEGKGFEMSETLSPLEKYRDVTVFLRVKNSTASHPCTCKSPKKESFHPENGKYAGEAATPVTVETAV